VASEANQRRTPPERAGSGPGQRCRSRCRPRQVEAGRTETELSVARAQIESRKADLELATIQLAESELKAPFDGVIAQLKLKEREYITPGTSVVQLADTATWQIETNDLTELHIVKVNQGDQVTITVDALPGFELPGMVKQIEDLGENQ
jgi:HlyD family secretion protein